ncbi:response regulator [Streptomyces radicis]|uniref:Response regulator n=1 Tax=Streptomyces radicis TaxID=1750517 RepID=A0A3A9WGM5_9ACTN|nr:response regulator [Streptomyces radicis]RKN08574.1 response regulator [Streptomyces radicis]RKN21732.1 response regulator [Streptomyces radicis]
MSESIWIKLIDTIPGVLWVAFAATVYFSLRGTITERMVPRMTAFRALGVEIELAGELLEQASAESDAAASATERRTALGRLEHAAALLRGGRVLWVDDRPEGNAPLVELFGAVGMTVDVALSMEEAVPRFRRKPYDVIISDLHRGGDPRAGTAGS